jgi:hypothetical protein
MTALAVVPVLIFGFVHTSRPARVELVQVLFPPVYAAGLLASREPLRYAR